MSDSKNDGGPAFPTCEEGRTMAYCTGGMTLRDWFAGMAMQGMLSCQDFMNEVCRSAASKDMAREQVAFWSYKQADAMLAQRDE